MTNYESKRSREGEAGGAEGAGMAPGKRTLTQGLAPRLHDTMARQFDPTGQYVESRLTIEGPPALTPRQVRKARRKNPRWQRRLGFDPARWSEAAVDSEEFAVDVAVKQARMGLRADGIVGPETAAAANVPEAGAVGAAGAGGAQAGEPDTQFDPTGQYLESRLTVEGPIDDPFALHL